MSAWGGEYEASTTPVELTTAPKTRGQCADGPRPCIFARCRYHVLHPERRARGWEEREGRDIMEMQTCSLDVADQGEHTLEAIGEMLGVTRERVRQIEEQAMARMAEQLGHRVDADVLIAVSTLLRRARG